MKIRKIFAVLLLLCILLGTFSCTVPTTENGAESESEIGAAADRLLASELSLYTVIISENISDEERTAINSLVVTVKNGFDVLLNIKTDIVEPSEKEIIIGDCDRSQSEAVLNMLRAGEHYVGFFDGKLIIGGTTAEDTVGAITAFEALISERVGDEVLFDSEADLIYNKMSFELSDLTLNGVSLTEYTILYTKENTKREKILSELIRDVVLERSGITVPVQSADKEVDGDVILVSQSSDALGENQAGFTVTENSVVLLGNTESDLFFAVQTLISRIEASTGDVQISNTETLSYKPQDVDLLKYGLTLDRITIMSYNVQNAGQGVNDVVSKYGKLATTIEFKNPDFICMQECVAGTGAAEGIRKNLTNRNSYTAIQGNKGTNAILYNSDKYTLLASEEIELGKTGDAEGSLYDRYFLWAKMQSKSSGATFVVISVHVDYTTTAGNAQFSRMLSYVEQNLKDMPVLIAGDYNIPKQQPMFDDLEAKGYEDTRDTTRSSKNATEVTYPQNNSVIDFIYERGFRTDYYEVLTQTINPSDHRPIFAECYLDLKN